MKHSEIYSLIEFVEKYIWNKATAMRYSSYNPGPYPIPQFYVIPVHGNKLRAKNMKIVDGNENKIENVYSRGLRK